MSIESIVPRLYRMSQSKCGKYVSFFKHDDTKIPNHTYSNPEYGWEMRKDIGFGAVTIPFCHPLPKINWVNHPKIGDTVCDYIGAPIKITHVIQTNEDLARFNIDRYWFLYVHVSSEIDRLREKRHLLESVQ